MPATPIRLFIGNQVARIHGLISSPTAGPGVVVTDSSGTERVRLGQLTDTDYGLKVVSSDGATVIIDGTSNMFKIVAEGTLSQNWPAGTGAIAQTSVVLSALGTFSGALPVTKFVVAPNTASNERHSSPYNSITSTGHVETYAFGWATLNATNLEIFLNSGTPLLSPGGGIVCGLGYFVMHEVAL